MNRLLYVVTLGLTTLFWSCQQEVVNEEGDHFSETVRFSTEVKSKGAHITTESEMVDMAVFCSYTGGKDWSAQATCNKMFNKKLIRKSSGIWEYDGDPVTWNGTVSERFTFFAYSPCASSENSIIVNGTSETTGAPTINYTVSEDLSKQLDLLVADPCLNLRPTGRPVALNYQHALSLIGFKANVFGTQDIASVKVTSIVINYSLAPKVVYSSGRHNLNSGDWYELSGRFNAPTIIPMPSTLPILNATPQSVVEKDGLLLMIPQKLEDKALTATIGVEITDDKGGITTRIYENLNLGNCTWERRKAVNYLFTIDLGNDIVGVESEIVPWIEKEINVEDNYLAVEKQNILMQGEVNSQSIEYRTDYQKPLSISTTESWIKNLRTENSKIMFDCDRYSYPMVRSAMIRITAGEISAVIKVEQKPTNLRFEIAGKVFLVGLQDAKEDDPSSIGTGNFVTSWSIAMGYLDFHDADDALMGETPPDGNTGCIAYWERSPNDAKTGKGKWRLPTTDEFLAIYNTVNLELKIYGFEPTYYWSSIEINRGRAYSGNYENGVPTPGLKFNPSYRMRCVRGE